MPWRNRKIVCERIFRSFLREKKYAGGDDSSRKFNSCALDARNYILK